MKGGQIKSHVKESHLLFTLDAFSFCAVGERKRKSSPLGLLGQHFQQLNFIGRSNH